MRVNIVGAGKLGKTLGRLLVDKARVEIGGVVNQTIASSNLAIDFIGQGCAIVTIAQLPAADITLITTPDDSIEQVTADLLLNEHLQDSIVAHCSGSLSSQLLSALKGKGCSIASVHPLHSFAKPALSFEQFQGSYCSMEGDKKALTQLLKLFTKIGGCPVIIQQKHKTRYHAASVFASNYVVALADISQQLFVESGLSTKDSKAMMTQLMQGVIANINQNETVKQALTGPIQRGDNQTIKNHLNSLPENEIKQLYRLLGKACINLSDLNQEAKKQLNAILL